MSQIKLLKMLLSPLTQLDQSLKPSSIMNQLASYSEDAASVSDEGQRVEGKVVAPLVSLCNLNLHLLTQVPLLQHRSTRTQNLTTNSDLWTAACDQMFSLTSHHSVRAHSAHWLNKAITKQKCQVLRLTQS